MKLIWGAVLFASTLNLSAQNRQEAETASQLADRARDAKDAGDLSKEADSLCRAASLDPKKFQKKCDKAKEELEKTLAQFEAVYEQARFEIQHKDYAGAVRDLGKITFGPHRGQAQALMVQAAVVGRLLPPEKASKLAWDLANAFYAKGDLDTTEAWLNYVTSPGFRTLVSQMQTNIHIYRDTMREANQLFQAHDLKGAAQKYQFAAKIAPNGPGNPGGQLQQVQGQQAIADQALDQQRKAAAQHAEADQGSAKQQQVQAPPAKRDASQLRTLLKEAWRAETAKNWETAEKNYAAALAIDPNRKEALDGHKRATDKLESNPKAVEALLEQGITQFYASDFIHARNSIGMYLQQGGKAHAGAAQFYLGATLGAQQILGDPKEKDQAEQLHQQEREHFAAARRLSFIPARDAVSPKIMDRWMLSSDAN